MNPNALIKLGTNALTKAGTGALTQAGTSALSNIVRDTATKALTKGLTGAGVSTLAKGAGSTLDGILGRSSGLVLPEPEVKTISLNDSIKNAYPDEYVDGVSGLMRKLDTSLDDLYKTKRLSKDSYNTFRDVAREGASFVNDVEGSNVLGITTKSDLPVLNRDQYYYDTLGSMRNADGSRSKYVSGADVPNYMKNHLSNKTTESNDSALRELFGDDTSDLSDLYKKYEDIASGGNANEIYTPENIGVGKIVGNIDTSKAEQDFADRVFRGKRDIAISGGSSPAKNVKVSRPTSTLGVEDAVAETPKTTNPELTSQIAELRSQITSTGGAGMGGNGGGVATELPGSEGFNVRLKNGEATNIQIQNSATGSTKRQRAIRKLDDMSAKSMNANAKQYKSLVGKSGSIDGHYKTVAERLRAEKIDQANVADKAQSALSGREDIKRQGLEYAEANGVTMDLSNIDNTIGLSATQKRKLAELGLGLDDMLGGNGIVTPTQAEDIYKTLRDYAYNWSDSKDALTKMAGNACEKEAEAVRDIIDNTMDNINVDYKTPLVEFMSGNGEDPAYIRKIAGKTDFKFSDLRKDQSDWIAMNDLAGNKIKEEPTVNVFGVDTGMKNPFTSGAEKIREKIYERQAYGGGGGSGAENTINFSSAGGERSGALGNLLGRAKGAGLVGAGLLGGLLLGGGGSGGGAGDLSAMSYGSGMGETADPYSQLTIGGYTYDQLEAGYMAALQAGDGDAAKLIANMMGMLDDKAKRLKDAKENSSSGVARKQRAALNVLSSLMQNYSAQGPIKGNITGFLNAITGGGYNPAVAAYDSGSQGSLGTIIKALGDTGALSEGDQKRALELLPKTTDSEQAAKTKYQQLIQILQGAGAQ